MRETATASTEAHDHSSSEQIANALERIQAIIEIFTCIRSEMELPRRGNWNETSERIYQSIKRIVSTTRNKLEPILESSLQALKENLVGKRCLLKHSRHYNEGVILRVTDIKMAESVNNILGEIATLIGEPEDGYSACAFVSIYSDSKIEILDDETAVKEVAERQ